MALNKKFTNLPLLFVVGVSCLFYGLGAAYVESNFSKLTIFISFIGLSFVLFCFILLRRFAKKTGRAFQWKKYGFVLSVIGLIIAFLVGINYLAYRSNLRWDITKAKQHTLSETTITTIKDLSKEVKIIAFYVGIPPSYLEDLFKECQRHSQGLIKTEIIDPIVQIGYAAKFGSVISGKERKVIVVSGGERKDIDFTDKPLSEEQLINAITKVVRDKRIIYFLTGHGEYDISDDGAKGLSILSRMLIANNAEVKTVMLGVKKEIPDDCDLLIVAGPKNSLTEEEEKIINEYLENGGDGLFLIENTPVTTFDKPLTEEEKRKNPSLNNILAEWGVWVADDIVVDLSNFIGKDVGCPATRNYPKHDVIVKDLDYTFYIRPRSISTLKHRRKTIKIAPLVLTESGGSSWAETDRTLNIKFNEEEDTLGPIPIAYIIWEPKEEGELADTHIAVFTDADFLSNAFIEKYSNAKLGLNVINWLLASEQKIFIDRKDIEIERLELTNKQKRIVIVILFLAPLFIAVGGIVTWLQRK